MDANISTTVGWVGVALAILAFGTMNIPIKLKYVQSTHVDPMILQMYMAFSIFATSWMVLIATHGKFTFSYWGIIGAALWVPASIFSIYAIRFLGLSVAQGLWSGLTILVSFLWGAVIFRDPVKNAWLTALGLVLLLVGIFGVAMCKSESAETKKEEDTESVKQPINEKTPLTSQQASVPIVEDSHHHQEQPLEAPTKMQKVKTILEKSKNLLLGLFCCVGLGLFNGSMMVPARFNPDKSIGYIASFGIGIIAVTPVLFIVYFIVKRQIPVFHVKRTLWPGMLVGAIWSVGNVSSTLASLSPLGLTVGFPLTQCALVVGGMLGIFVFRELKGWRPILQFFFFTFLFLLPGCMLLALFGKA